MYDIPRVRFVGGRREYPGLWFYIVPLFPMLLPSLAISFPVFPPTGLTNQQIAPWIYIYVNTSVAQVSRQVSFRVICLSLSLCLSLTLLQLATISSIRSTQLDRLHLAKRPHPVPYYLTDYISQQGRTMFPIITSSNKSVTKHVPIIRRTALFQIG